MVKLSLVMTKEKRSELVGALVTPSIKAEIQAIVEAEERTRSYVGGALIERGLEAYRKDRLLRSRGHDGKLPVIRAKTEETSRKKKRHD